MLQDGLDVTGSDPNVSLGQPASPLPRSIAWPLDDLDQQGHDVFGRRQRARGSCSFDFFGSLFLQPSSCSLLKREIDKAAFHLFTCEQLPLGQAKEERLSVFREFVNSLEAEPEGPGGSRPTDRPASGPLDTDAADDRPLDDRLGDDAPDEESGAVG